MIIPAEGINSLIEPRERQALTLFPGRSRKVDVIEKRIGEEEREEKVEGMEYKRNESEMVPLMDGSEVGRKGWVGWKKRRRSRIGDWSVNRRRKERDERGWSGGQ